MALDSSLDVATYIVDEVMSITFDRVAPAEVTMYELVNLMVLDVAQIVNGEAGNTSVMEEPHDILELIDEAIRRVDNVRGEVWPWEYVLDLIANCIALTVEGRTTTARVIQWIERGLSGTHFEEFVLNCRVYEYAVLFDNDVHIAPSA